MPKTELKIEDVQVHVSGDDVRISLSSQGGDQRDLLIPLDHLGELIKMLARVHLDASVAKLHQSETQR